MPTVAARPPTLLNILLAMLYDSLLVIGCIIVIGFIAVALNKFRPILPHSWQSYCLFFFIMLTWCLFFAYFWSQHGQTLGMRSWRLILVTDNDSCTPSFPQAVWRWCVALLLLAPLGIGLWWRLIDNRKRTLYDRLSKTYLIRVACNPYSHKKGKM